MRTAGLDAQHGVCSPSQACISWVTTTPGKVLVPAAPLSALGQAPPLSLCPFLLHSGALATGGQGARGRSVRPGDTGPLGHLSRQEHEGPLLLPALTLSSYVGFAVSSGIILEILFFVKKIFFYFC